MNIIIIMAICIIILPIVTVLIARLINICKYKIKTQNGIQESTYIEINGIKQYIQIRGEDTNNPVMIFIHGGPAGPMGYVSAYFQKALESELTIIHYDQRGCGRTYYTNNKDSNTNVHLLLDDLNEIVKYAKQRFGKEKVIIAGHSWGSSLGTIYVQTHPENVMCYIGISQVTNCIKNKISIARMALEKEEIRGTEDESLLYEIKERFEKLTKYDDLSINDLMHLVTISGKYIACKGQVSALKTMWLGVTSPDMNLKDVQWFFKTMNVNFFHQNRQLMEYAMFEFDIEELPRSYNVPVYFIAGEGDYSICQTDARLYYESIDAPDKAFYMLKNVGHNMFMDNPILFCNTIKDIITKMK